MDTMCFNMSCGYVNKSTLFKPNQQRKYVTCDYTP